MIDPSLVHGYRNTTSISGKNDANQPLEGRGNVAPGIYMSWVSNKSLITLNGVCSSIRISVTS